MSTCLIAESESSHCCRTSSGDETDEDSFVDGLHAKADLVFCVFAQNYLKIKLKTFCNTKSKVFTQIKSFASKKCGSESNPNLVLVI